MEPPSEEARIEAIVKLKKQIESITSNIVHPSQIHVKDSTFYDDWIEMTISLQKMWKKLNTEIKNSNNEYTKQ